MTDQHAPAGDDRLAEFGHRQELERGPSTADLLVCGPVFMVCCTSWGVGVLPEHRADPVAQAGASAPTSARGQA